MDSGYRLLAAEALLQRLRTMTAHAPGVQLSDDIESLHRMRVASRRLRTALAVFKEVLPSKRSKQWRKAIRKVTRSLGPARDLDVQIAFLRHYLAGIRDESLRPGVELVLHSLTTCRGELQPEIQDEMARLNASDDIEEFRSYLRKIRKQERREFTGRFSEQARQRAATEILDRVQDFLSYTPFVYDAAAAEEHHKMRIAAKRLRYAMEIFDPLWQGDLAGPTDMVRDFQRVLGWAHDCDVWIDFVPDVLARLEKQGKQTKLSRVRPGLEHLLADQHRRRAELYHQFSALFHQRMAEGFWSDLRHQLLHPPQPHLQGIGGEE
jgi:CHAD domain-containing protein